MRHGARVVVAGFVFLSAVQACEKEQQSSFDAAAEAARQLAESAGGLGKEVAGTYVAMMDELEALVTPKPGPADVRPKLAELRERYVALLVEQGRKREALSQDGREAFDRALRKALMDLPSDAFEWLARIAAHYRPLDAALADELAAFEAMTQYAVFEQLGKQLPDEAKRLGIR